VRLHFISPTSVQAAHFWVALSYITFFADIWNQVFHPETPPPMSPTFFLAMHCVWMAASLFIFSDHRKVEARQKKGNKQK
jgi:hypothetical protein